MSSVGTAGAPAGARSIEQILDGARTRLARLTPLQAHEAVQDGALLVDIRPVEQRHREGTIPAALAIERNVLEWRLDPAADARLPIAAYDLRVIVVCSEGYTSSLAAAALLELGISQATDVIGGVRAWREAGLPLAQ